MQVIRVTLRLTSLINEGIEKIAKTNNQSKNTVIVNACKELVEKYRKEKK